ncbi:MAG: hypothetical protein AB7E29_12600 [Xanthobacter sp.]
MAGSNIVSLFRTRPANRDWNNQELAEFYRVESALLSVGFRVDTDRGLTDEGEPWFIFADANSGDVIVHCARTDGAYLIASAAFDQVLRGPDFRTLVETFLERNPLVLPPADTPEKKNNVRLHPSALLVALVATAFFKLSITDAEAAGHDDGPEDGDLYDRDETPAQTSAEMDRRQSLVVLAAVAVVTSQLHGDMDQDIASSFGSTSLTAKEASSHEDFSAMLAATGLTHDTAQRANMSDVIASGFHEGPQEGYVTSDGNIDQALSDLIKDSSLLDMEQTLDLDFSEISHAHQSADQEIEGLASSLQSDGAIALSALFANSTTNLLKLAQQTLSISSSEDEQNDGAQTATSSADQSIKTLVDASVDLKSGSSTVSFSVSTKTSETNGTTNSDSDTDADTLPAEAPPTSQPEVSVNTADILKAVAPYLDINAQRVKYSDNVYAFDQTAKDFITDYVLQDGNTSTFSYGSDVVIYDARMAYAGQNIHFVTWSMDDGSTISLIGTFDYPHVA